MVVESLLAVVPSKPFTESKQRLASVLDPVTRIDLSRRLFERTLAVLAKAKGITRVAVVARDEEALRLAREHGAWAIWETQAGLNQALEQASRVARANGFARLLVLPADLPELTTSHVERMAALGADPPCVVIAPAQRDGGTNGLLVNPVGLIAFDFGEASFAAHQARAAQAGARIEIYRSPGLAFDLDLPEDWERLQAAAGRVTDG